MILDAIGFFGPLTDEEMIKKVWMRQPTLSQGQIETEISNLKIKGKIERFTGVDGKLYITLGSR